MPRHSQRPSGRNEEMTTGGALPGCLTGVRVLDLTRSRPALPAQRRSPGSVPRSLRWKTRKAAKRAASRCAGPLARARTPGISCCFNANKKSVTGNLKSERGLKLVKNMAKRADVMVENFAPGVIERLGLCYDVIRAVNPSIVYAWHTADFRRRRSLVRCWRSKQTYACIRPTSPHDP
jgi:formyl-CoA transferase